MIPIIEFCVNNARCGTGELIQKLEQQPHIDVVEYSCVGQCSTCAAQPFALVDGQIVYANTAEQLYLSIMEQIEQGNV